MEKKLDLRIEKTYLALHKAFIELLEEKRFETFTVNELCQHAMIRRTTFYKLFADKYEYLSFFIREICADFRATLSPEIQDNGINAYFLHMTRQLIRFIRGNGQLIRNALDSTMFPMLLNILMEHIVEDLLQVSPQRTAQSEAMASFYAGGLLNTLFRRLRQSERIDEDQFVGMISQFLPQDTATP